MTDWGYAAGWLTVRAMPEFAARNVFDAGALYASRNGGPDQLRKNLARVIGVAPKDVPGSLMRASLASYARYWREAFRLPAMDHHALGQQLAETVSGSRTSRCGAGQRPRCGGGVAAQRELGYGRGVDGPDARHDSPPSPSGSNPSRCTGGSSTTGKAWASR